MISVSVLLNMEQCFCFRLPVRIFFSFGINCSDFDTTAKAFTCLSSFILFQQLLYFSLRILVAALVVSCLT